MLGMLQLARPPDADLTVPVTHQDVTCDRCGVSPVVGVRYKCVHCSNYDLCMACERLDPLTFHAPDHLFLKLRWPMCSLVSVASSRSFECGRPSYQ